MSRKTRSERRIHRMSKYEKRRVTALTKYSGVSSECVGDIVDHARRDAVQCDRRKRDQEQIQRVFGGAISYEVFRRYPSLSTERREWALQLMMSESLMQAVMSQSEEYKRKMFERFGQEIAMNLMRTHFGYPVEMIHHHRVSMTPYLGSRDVGPDQPHPSSLRHP